MKPSCDRALLEAIDYQLFLYRQKYAEGDMISAGHLLYAVGVLIRSLPKNINHQN